MFTIGTVSQLTGLSPNGIRYYETRHLLEPLRGGNGKYRDYSPRTLSELLDVKNFRGCGFSLEETARLRGEESLDPLPSALQDRAEALEEEIVTKRRLVGYLRRRASSIEAAMAAPFSPPREIAAPDILWLPVEQEGRDAPAPAPRRDVRAWLEKAPFVDSCLLFPVGAFSRTDGPVEASWGLAIDAEYEDILPKGSARHALRLPGGRSLALSSEIDEALRLASPSAKVLRSLLEAPGLRLSGPVISRRLANLKDGSGIRRIDETWIHMDSAEA